MKRREKDERKRKRKEREKKRAKKKKKEKGKSHRERKREHEFYKSFSRQESSDASRHGRSAPDEDSSSDFPSPDTPNKYKGKRKKSEYSELLNKVSNLQRRIYKMELRHKK